MLVNVSAKITDKLASRWKVTCPARKNALAVTAWHQGLPGNAMERHLLSHGRRDQQGQEWRD